MNTSFIERLNLTIRQGSAYLSRRTLSHARATDTLEAHLELPVFWIDPKQIAPQIGLAATSMLTLIAFQFAFIGLLPRISYLTRADRFILSSSVLVFIALVEAVTASTLAPSRSWPIGSTVPHGGSSRSPSERLSSLPLSCSLVVAVAGRGTKG